MTPYQQTIDEALAAVAATRDGLSSDEAHKRLEKFGLNELGVEKPIPSWRKFLAQFQDVLVILLLIATAISFALWFYERDAALPYEGLAIFAVVLLNAVMGYIQEARAETAVAALRQMSAAHANVVRDGERRSVLATEVVPGDIILVGEGDTIPADARLIQSTALQTAEASLTGESLPVLKDTAPIKEAAVLGDRINMIFSGTAATFGHGRAVVVATGMQTEMGNIAGMLKAAPPEVTPLQRELNRTGKLLGLIVVAIAVVMIATIVIIEDVRGLTALIDVLILGREINLPLDKIPQARNAGIVVFDNGAGSKKISKWKSACEALSIPCWDVAEKGAFVLTVN